MRERSLIGLVLLLSVAGSACRRDSQGNVQPAPETTATGNRVGRAAGDLGQAAVQGAEGAAHGVVCGTRELGQTMSGTQGDPQAEARSREACDKAQQRANEAEQSINRIPQDTNQNAHGGGPSR